MNWIEQGGFMTWPLLALSVVVLAVMFDRFIVYTTFAQPNAKDEDDLIDLIKRGDSAGAIEKTTASFPDILPLVQSLCQKEKQAVLETDAIVRIEEIMRSLDKHVSLLALASRVAPLMGLLGTIIGIIHTFSSVSSTRGGADMSALAEGIWQALIATSVGLCIAIPSVLAHHACQKRAESIGFALRRLANRALVRKGEGLPS